MFGYITIDKPELKIKDFDLYQCYYCGMCRNLKWDHGRFGQLCVNYDMTFLAMLLTGLYEPESKRTDRKCLLHPLAHHDMITNEYTEYAADMSLVLMYYKCEDDWNDEKKLKGGALKTALSGSMRRLNQKYPGKLKLVKSKLLELSDKEQQGETNLDLVAGLFGQIMGEICRPKEDEWSEDLYRMGFFLGKFIYLMDAWDDLSSDLEHGQYNPFSSYKDREDFDTWCESILKMMIAECCRSFERLPILLYGDILRNVLYSGVWNTFRYKNAEKYNDDIKEEESIAD